MFFDYNEDKEIKWKRIERKIYSPFWRFIHNFFAHPLMAIYRPLGERFHEWTAEKMYKVRETKSLTLSDKD